jgi:hypothetical protein
MNEEEQRKMEAQLRQCFPARLPEQLMARIFAGQSCYQHQATLQPRNPAGLPGWFGVLRWLAPAAVAVVIFMVWRKERLPTGKAEATRGKPVAALNANGVQLNEKLVSSFDAVAQLPSGEPVRFRVQKWQDNVVVKDKARGLLVSESAPRWEVVPVGFETY